MRCRITGMKRVFLRVFKVLLHLLVHSTTVGYCHTLPRPRNPATTFTCPDYELRVPDYSRLSGVLPHVLQNRTILFVGDSTMLHQFMTFVKFTQCDTSSLRKLYHPDDFRNKFPPKRTLLSSQRGAHRKGYTPKPKTAIPRMPEPSSYFSEWLNLTIEFWPYGVLSTYHATEQAGYQDWLSLRMSQTSSTDIIVMNLGIHWDFNKTVRDFEEALESFFKLMGWKEELSRRCESGHSVQKKQIYDNNKPIVLWRETIPQHFNTSNGHYPGDGAPRVYRQCAPATIARSTGKAFGTECIPNCFPSNWHNDVANKLVHHLSSCGININIIHLWEELICLHDSHKGITTGDCAHLSNDEKTNALLHWKLLKTLLPLLEIPLPHSWHSPPIASNIGLTSKSSADAENGFYSYF